jgi:hypothetical protein
MPSAGLSRLWRASAKGTEDALPNQVLWNVGVDSCGDWQAH